MRLSDGKVEVLKKAKSVQVPAEGVSFLVYHLRKPKAKKGKDEKGTEKEGKTEAGGGGPAGPPFQLTRETFSAQYSSE